MADTFTSTTRRDQTEAQRLDEQFKLLNRNIGYLLHPSITNKMSSSPNIADIGTGTGIFLSELAELYPKATLRGFDVSQRLFPTPERLPANVELTFMDIKKPPPPTEHHRYDVVHLRLLTATMDAHDWEVVLGNAIMLLKPGGVLQWEECNFADARHLRGDTDSSVSAARRMGSLFRKGLEEKISYGWSTLPQIMRKAGLLDVDEDIVSSDRDVETRKALTANGMLAMFAWAKRMSSSGAPESLPVHELDALEVQAERDIASGCYVRFDIHINVGFKPLRV